MIVGRFATLYLPHLVSEPGQRDDFIGIEQTTSARLAQDIGINTSGKNAIMKGARFV